MSSIFTRISRAGISDTTPKFQAKAILLANTIALIASTLDMIFLLYSLQNGWSYYDSIIFILLTILLGIPSLNVIGMTNASRVVLSFVIPAFSMIIIFWSRIQHPENYEYTRSPGMYAMLLACATIPVLVFSSREKITMSICVCINLLVFAMLDIVLRYYSSLHALPSVGQYISGNISLLLAYLLLIGSVLSLKKIIDDYEERNEILITSLNEKNGQLERTNHDLIELNNNIETQNEEILSQSEELVQSQENLIIANNEIERQKQKLEEQNEFLAQTLDERSKDLIQSNQQLVTQNNELHQFSYTVSHNLRGPVASMLGLINIHQHAHTDEEKKKILHLLQQSATSLETVIVDLNKIIDLRNDKFSPFEEVSLEHELELVKNSLNSFIASSQVIIESNFGVDKLVSIKTYIHSIVYNLISNAIQYRSPEREATIKINSKTSGDDVVIEVSDNGLGIDLTKFRGDLFKLYKRFHSHTQGKGLGLYLVNQHVQKLKGHIEIESKPDVGTTFRIFLPAKME